MIYRPFWNATRILVFNGIVLDFPKDQKDLTISILLFIVLCFDLYSSLLVPYCFALIMHLYFASYYIFLLG